MCDLRSIHLLQRLKSLTVRNNCLSMVAIEENISNLSSLEDLDLRGTRLLDFDTSLEPLIGKPNTQKYLVGMSCL